MKQIIDGVDKSTLDTTKVPYTGATQEVVLGQDLTLADDKKLYFDTAKTNFIMYDTNFGSFRMGDNADQAVFAAADGFYLYSMCGADGSGNCVPEFNLSDAGGVYMDAWGATKEEIVMRAGGNHFASLKTSNLAADKTFQFPNASGAIGTIITKADTGDPTGVEGVFCTNTFDNTFKVYADGAWRTLSTW